MLQVAQRRGGGAEGAGGLHGGGARGGRGIGATANVEVPELARGCGVALPSLP